MSFKSTSIERIVFWLLALLILLAARHAYPFVNQWTTYGPVGESIRALAIDPVTRTTLYAGTSNGAVFKSTTGGTSWLQHSSGLPGFAISALAIDPTTPTILYAGTSGNGIFKSTNGGTTWEPSNAGLPPGLIITSLAINPAIPTTLYAGTPDAGVFETTTAGASWIPTDPSIASLGVTALAIDPVITTTLYAATSKGGVVKSVTGGATWVVRNTGLPTGFSVAALVINSITPTTLYAGTSAGIYMSTTGGATWAARNLGLPSFTITTLAIDPTTPTTLYAGTANSGVFKTTTAASDWFDFNPLLTALTIQALTIDPTTGLTLYAGTPAGVFDLEIIPDHFPLSVSVQGTGTGVVTTTIGAINCSKGNTGLCATTLPAGTNETLTATPTGNSTFDGWGGDCAPAGAAATCAFSMTAARRVTATFTTPSVEPDAEVFIANAVTNSITVYPRTASGDTPPLRILQGPATGLNNLAALRLDPVNGELVAANWINSITVYTRTASGNNAPLRTLGGSATGLDRPTAIQVDPVHNELLVANAGIASVTAYTRTAIGNIPPLRTLSGPSTQLAQPAALVLDPVHNELFVANADTDSITVYPRTANGNTLPIRILQGPGTGLDRPVALALDTVHNELLVVNNNSNTLTVYPRTANANGPLLRILTGPATALDRPVALALDTIHDEVLVVNNRSTFSNTLTVYARTANGNIPPLRTLQGPDTGLTGPVAIDITRPPDLSAGASAFITRLYQQVLGREPDPIGLQAFLQQIQESSSVVPTVFAFFHSNEFANRTTSNEQFLTILYLTFLNRPPDPDGLSGFLAALATGQLTRDNLLDIFIDSQEFATQANFLPPLDPLSAFVTTLYVRILGRGPDQAGLQGFVAQLEQTRTVLPTVQLFLSSPEFEALRTTNGEFVTLLYRVFLDRIPDAQGLASFVARLDQGTSTRAQLLAQFAASPEFQAIQHQLFP